MREDGGLPGAGDRSVAELEEAVRGRDAVYAMLREVLGCSEWELLAECARRVKVQADTLGRCAKLLGVANGHAVETEIKLRLHQGHGDGERIGLRRR